MTFKSAYLKLTFVYVLIVMAISLAFSFTIYNISSRELERGLGRQTRMLGEFNKEDRPPLPLQDLEKIRMEQLQASNNRLKLNLIYFNALILVLASAFSYFSAKRTMRPIEDIISAQNIFIADASHELKTPLTAIRSEIEVGLRNRSLTLAESKKLLASNLEEVSKLETLSNALLNLAKYQQDAKLEFKEIPLTEVIIEAYEKVEKLARQKSIKFKNKFKKIYLKGDRQSLIELFVILLDNAIKYSPKNSKINIIVKEQKKWAVVIIKDCGIGVKASDLPHIFDRFYRADHSRTKATADGYGLGLSIAKRIVKLHQGIIYAKSTPGKGSQFVVKLPIFSL